MSRRSCQLCFKEVANLSSHMIKVHKTSLKAACSPKVSYVPKKQKQDLVKQRCLHCIKDEKIKNWSILDMAEGEQADNKVQNPLILQNNGVADNEAPKQGEKTDAQGDDVVPKPIILDTNGVADNAAPKQNKKTCVSGKIVKKRDDISNRKTLVVFVHQLCIEM